MYFKDFPLVTYLFEIDGRRELLIVRDIALNVRVRKNIIENITLYDEYDIWDGETPEIIAEKLYGNPNYHWIIMLVNERYNIADFPLSEDRLFELVDQKYGVAAHDTHVLYGQEHHETPDGMVVDADFPLAQAISNRDYEVRENEKKRRIRVINPGLIDKVVAELREAMLSARN